MSDDPTVVVGGETAAPSPAPSPVAGNGAAPPAPAPLLGDDGAGGDAGEQQQATWPDDWRERWAGKDDQALKTLKRWASPDNVFKSWMDQRRMIGAGQLRPALAEGATEEEVAAYRKSVGIPESPEGYELAFPEDVGAGDAQKAQLAAIAKAAHGEHIPPKHVQTLLNAYVGLQREEAQQRHEANLQARQDAEVALRTKYGRDFKMNMNIANNAIAEHAGDAGKDMVKWPLADGTALGDHPEFVEMMMSLGRAVGGADTVEYNEYTGGGKTVDEQIQEALALVNTDTRKYDSPEHQAKLIKLYEVKQKQSSRAA